jgi:uncharacterized membrane protein YkoI
MNQNNSKLNRNQQTINQTHKIIKIIKKKLFGDMHAIRLMKFDGKERRDGEAVFENREGEERVF